MTLNANMSDVSDILIEDPAAPDNEADVEIVTTRRAITRVVMVAAETASRFEREALPHDPVAWMCAPRRLFLGGCAIDACLALEDFERAILLHGLSLGIDAEPADIDELVSDDDVVDYEAFGTNGNPSAKVSSPVADGASPVDFMNAHSTKARVEFGAHRSDTGSVENLQLGRYALQSSLTGDHGRSIANRQNPRHPRSGAPSRRSDQAAGRVARRELVG